MYRLVAYHNYKTERQSINLSTNINSLKTEATRLDPKEYPNMHLVIEYNGKTLVSYFAKNGVFEEYVKEDK